MKSKVWYEILKHDDHYTVWFNHEEEHSMGCEGIYSARTKKECEKYCKENKIVVYKGSKR